VKIKKKTSENICVVLSVEELALFLFYTPLKHLKTLFHSYRKKIISYFIPKTLNNKYKNLKNFHKSFKTEEVLARSRGPDPVGSIGHYPFFFNLGVRVHASDLSISRVEDRQQLFF